MAENASRLAIEAGAAVPRVAANRSQHGARLGAATASVWRP